jgi:predicted small lipoprotein YifL
MSDLQRICLPLLLAGALSACGQTGRLYLPGTSGEVTTRSTQTPPESGGAAGAGGTANSPQTVDSPPAPATPAPEVTAPEGEAAAGEDQKGKKNPPPEPQKK